jgi:hypothetical protein
MKEITTAQFDRENGRGYEYQTMLAAILVFGFVCFVLVLEMLVR